MTTSWLKKKATDMGETVGKVAKETYEETKQDFRESKARRLEMKKAMTEAKHEAELKAVKGYAQKMAKSKFESKAKHGGGGMLPFRIRTPAEIQSRGGGGFGLSMGMAPAKPVVKKVKKRKKRKVKGKKKKGSKPVKVEYHY